MAEDMDKYAAHLETASLTLSASVMSWLLQSKTPSLACKRWWGLML